ncbi:hypothetical protein Agub_g6378, partial [Astrephomene gubernaculifera]
MARRHRAQVPDWRSSDANSLPVLSRDGLRRLSIEINQLLDAYFQAASQQGGDARGLAQDPLDLQKSICKTLLNLQACLDVPAVAETVVAEVVANNGIHVALLRLIAVGVRLTPNGGLPGSSTANYQRACSETSVAAMDFINQIIYRKPAAAVDIARKLLRMQTLQACSRQLAAASQSLLASSGGQPQHPEEDHGGSVMHARDFANHVAWLASTVLYGLDPSFYLESVELCEEITFALQDSCVLDHWARLLLAMAATAPEQEDRAQHRSRCRLSTSFLTTCCTIISVAASAAEEEEENEEEEEAENAPSVHDGCWVRQLRSAVLSSCCVQHAIVVHGLVALCKMDGGPTYGLAPDLLRHIPVGGAGPSDSGCGLCDPAACFDALICAFRYDVPMFSWSEQAVLGLLLRIARLAAPFILETSGGWGNGGDGNTSSSSSSSGGGTCGASMNRRGCAGDAGGSGGRRNRGQEAEGGGIMSRHRMLTISLQGLLRAWGLIAWEQPDNAEATEWWRLAVGFLPVVEREGSPEDQRLIATVLMRVLATDAPPGEKSCLPPTPPLQVALALAAGLLPCLEGLLRHADADETENTAAAMVRTLGKLLRKTHPWVMSLVLGRRDCRLCCHVFDVIVMALDVAYEVLGAGPHESAAGGTESAPERQLKLVLSCALWDWLPVMSRIAKWASLSVVDNAGRRGTHALWRTHAVLLQLVPPLAFRCMLDAASTAGHGVGRAATSTALPPAASSGGGGAVEAGTGIAPPAPPVSSARQAGNSAVAASSAAIPNEGSSPKGTMGDSGGADVAAAAATAEDGATVTGAAASAAHRGNKDAAITAPAAPDGGWRRVLLGDMEAFHVLGCALEATGLLQDSSEKDWLVQHLPLGCGAVAAACPQELRQATTDAAKVGPWRIEMLSAMHRTLQEQEEYCPAADSAHFLTTLPNYWDASDCDLGDFC